jgi:tRNA-Thr(GGU) m(6)t(6)A37 methyltransferase TsaA
MHAAAYLAPSLSLWRAVRCVHTRRRPWAHAAAVAAGAAALSDAVTYSPVAVFEGPFKRCNGTPRQGALVPAAKGRVRLLDDALASGGAAALDGLSGFSHCYLLWHFSANQPSRAAAKVAPPRLGGARVGVFATRSPHRPNALGLTVVRVERVEGTCIHVSGADLLDGTPILDIKPYLPCYDSFPAASIPSWLADAPVTAPQTVHFSPAALAGLDAAAPSLRFCTSAEDAQATLVDALRSELRSPYRRTSPDAKEDVYAFFFDCLDVRCVFSADSVTVIDIELANLAHDTGDGDGIAPSDAATFTALLSPGGMPCRVSDQLDVMFRANGCLLGVPAGPAAHAGADAVIHYDWRGRQLRVSAVGAAPSALSVDDLLTSRARGHKRLQATAMFLLKGPVPGGVSGWLRPGQRIGVAALWDSLAARPPLDEAQYVAWQQRAQRGDDAGDLE